MAKMFKDLNAAEETIKEWEIRNGIRGETIKNLTKKLKEKDKEVEGLRRRIKIQHEIILKNAEKQPLIKTGGKTNG